MLPYRFKFFLQPVDLFILLEELKKPEIEKEIMVNMLEDLSYLGW